jgi:hypothetical protein
VRRAAKGLLAGLAAAVAALALGGCQAELIQGVQVNERGTGELTLTLRLDPDAQTAINLDRQLQDETFLEFLRPDLEGWSAPDGSGRVIGDRTEADGTRVFETRRSILSSPDDLRDILSEDRPIAPIVEATGGLYQLPPPAEDAGETTATAPATAPLTALPPAVTTTPAPRARVAPQSVLTDLSAIAPLQEVLVLRFEAAQTGPDRAPATFRIATRGGVGEIGDATCSSLASRPPTIADRQLQDGLTLRYRYRMPSPVESASDGAERTRGQVAWSMPYGRCDLLEASSAGASSTAAVNGLILGGALGFILIVLGLRALSKRRRRRRTPV